MDGISETNKEGISVTEKKGRGRPKTGKVLFAKRVTPEMASQLQAVIAGTVWGVMTDAERQSYEKQIEGFRAMERKPVARQSASTETGSCRECAEIRESNKLLLATIGEHDAVLAKKDEEIEKLKQDVQKVARASPDVLVQKFAKKYDELKAAWDAKFGANEFAQ